MRFTRMVRTGLSITVSTPAMAAQWTMWVTPRASVRRGSASSTSPSTKVKFGWSSSWVPESASRWRLSTATISFSSTSRRATVVPMKPAPPVIRIRLPRNTARPTLACDQLLEPRVAPKRYEVVVRPRVLAQTIRARERFAEVLERLVLRAEQRLHAGDVVERERIAGVPVQDPTADLERRRVVLGVVGLEEVAHRLARRDRERLPRRRADRDDERPVPLGDRAPAELRVADEDGGAVRRIDLLACDREDRVAGEDDVQLLVPVRAGAGLVVFPDHARPRGGRPHRVDAEGADSELGAKANVLALAVFLCGRRFDDRERGEPCLRCSRHHRPSQAGRATGCRSRGLVFRRNAPRRRFRSSASARRRSARSTERSLWTSRSG